MRMRKSGSGEVGKCENGPCCLVGGCGIIAGEGENTMGELYRIGSLIVNMRFKDNKQHHKPHVHAKCGNDEAVVGVDGELLAGGYLSGK